MSNTLVVTQAISISVGNSTQSFAVDDEVPSYSIYAPALLYGGFAVDSGNPDPPSGIETTFSAYSSLVQSVYYGSDPNKSRPNAQVVIWIGDLEVEPVNAFSTDVSVQEPN